jgi:hypothetical protein
MWCPLRPSAVNLVAGHTNVDQLLRMSSFGLLEAFTSRSKTVFNLDNSSLTEEREDSTSFFHVVKDSSNSAVADSWTQREVVLDLLTDLLHQLFDQWLDVGIHGSELLLPMSEVIVFL